MVRGSERMVAGVQGGCGEEAGKGDWVQLLRTSDTMLSTSKWTSSFHPVRKEVASQSLKQESCCQSRCFRRISIIDSCFPFVHLKERKET